jgi:arabinan endo-1,5-alpha-L-arabinosidase
VKWEFVGWVFPSIPDEALESIKKSSGGQTPNGIWAPYIFKAVGEYRLYYSVSVFGANTSFIGLATAKSPEGPWLHKACVVATGKSDSMNAIDPTIVDDAESGHQWMIYGSYFSGIHCVELNPMTGLCKNPGDKGHVVARRANGDTRVIEAPEVIYNPDLKKYYLFVSYDALFTHYNVRVGRADKPEGPYLDFFGNDMSESINHYPILTYAYRFSGHSGWAGVGHCSVIRDNRNYFMLHQGRLAPENLMMVLHVRQIKWSQDGWPLVSPERYGAMPKIKIKHHDIAGKWEKIELCEIADSVKLWQGQIPWGGWRYDTIMFNNFQNINLLENGTIDGAETGFWKFENEALLLTTNHDTLLVSLFPEWDWEKKQATLVFTGLNKKGISIWGKKVN